MKLMLNHLVRCRRGVTAMTFLMVAIPLIGFLALGTEAGAWYTTKRHAQNAADAAAYSGALSLAANAATTDWAVQGAKSATQNGFCIAVTGVTCPAAPTGTTQTGTIVRGNWSGGAFAANANGMAVQAIVTQTQPPLLVKAFRTTDIAIPATAVATITNPGKPCLLALSETGAGITIKNNVTLTNCTLATNNRSATAVDISKHLTFTCTSACPSPLPLPISTAGGCIGSECAQVQTYMPPVTNPVQKVIAPDGKTLDQEIAALAKPTSGGGLPFCPGTTPLPYSATTVAGVSGPCKNHALTDTAVLKGGVYFFSGGIDWTNKSNKSVTADGTGGSSASLVILMPDEAGNPPILTMKNSATFAITGPTSIASLPAVLSPFATVLTNMALYYSGTDIIANNNASFTIHGTMYMPNTKMTANNNFNLNVCGSMIVADATFKNNTTFDNSCPSLPSPLVTQIVRLVQ